MKDFKGWMDTTGQVVYEEVLAWLETMPDSIAFQDLGIYDLDEFAFSICEERYQTELSDYEDYLYDSRRDDEYA